MLGEGRNKNWMKGHKAFTPLQFNFVRRNAEERAAPYLKFSFSIFSWIIQQGKMRWASPFISLFIQRIKAHVIAAAGAGDEQ